MKNAIKVAILAAASLTLAACAMDTMDNDMSQQKMEKEKRRAYEERSAAQSDTGNLVGMRARNLDDEMATRGFSNVGGYKTDTSSFTTWWNADSRECLSVETSQGRIANVDSIVEGNCL